MKQSSLQLCPTCNTMKRFDGDMCVRCEGEKTDWEKKIFDKYPPRLGYMVTGELIDFIRTAIQQAIAQERERTKQVVRQAQIAMGYIEDDEQADWCLNRFNALLDDDLKLDIITNNHEDHKE